MIKFYTTGDDLQYKNGELYVSDGMAVKTHDGKITDISNLSEKQIFDIIKNDYLDFNDSNGSYKTHRRELDTFTLLNFLKNNNQIDWNPSCNMIFQLASIDKQGNHLLSKIINVTDINHYYENAMIIASFQKKCLNDFSNVKPEEKLNILKQMAINEQKEREIRKQQNVNCQQETVNLMNR